MAHDAIIEKLERELQEPITSESQVVYLLVEIRKLIELNKDVANYRTLKFCCDWVAHPVLEGSEARSIVRQLDKYQEVIEEMNNAADGEALTADMSFLDALDGVLRLSRFRSELGAYLGLRGLSSSIADCDKEWANF